MYLSGAAVLGVLLVYEAIRLRQRPGIEGAKQAYLYSLLYLALLFAVIVTDSLVAV